MRITAPSMPSPSQQRQQQQQQQPTSNHPLIVELAVYQDNAFLSDEAITAEVQRLLGLYPQGAKFVLKILGKLATDIDVLNAKALLIEKLLPGYPILFELSYERLVLVSRLNESVFLRPWVYPALKYYLRKGDESLCIDELKKLFRSVQPFTGIQLVLTISINRPFPRLNELLQLVRQNAGLIRVVTLSLERPPKEILSSVKLKAQRADMMAREKARSARDAARGLSGEAKIEIQIEKEKHREKEKEKEKGRAPAVPISHRSPVVNRNATSLKTKEWARTVVPCGSTGLFEVSRQADIAGTRLCYEFRVEDKDIDFCILFQGMDEVYFHNVEPVRRIYSQNGTIEGEVVAKEPGTFKLRWDNSYSRFTTKAVHYCAYVELPLEPTVQIEEDEDLIGVNTIDPFDLLITVERATNKEISTEDFFPVSTARVLEPFLQAIGYGKFTIRPSPFCGFGTVLINTESYRSVPLTRLFNFTRFYFDMLPQIKDFETQSLVTGLLLAQKMRKIIKRAETPAVELPDVVSCFTDPSKLEATETFIHNVQFLVVHNNMDIASLDLVRRCNCSNMTSAPTAGASAAGLVASCAGCI
eukprot:TRINITY_DN3610_c1_g3_i1.p1 TRINITY_DN3610_c1_g3~~TRINITY_DN3610_c1_g3_i1.p1  ORF type:complete len:677 (-),score=102.42 TRINITY_DN3610_c1_g3_i1:39-1796(-)